jgi:hypothetical protein
MTTTWAEPLQLSFLPDPLEVRFLEFHHANPHVYAALVDMAHEWRNAGHDSGSIAMFFEVLRWRVGITTSGEQFVLNNSYRSRYARLIAANEPELRQFFHTRQLRNGEME